MSESESASAADFRPFRSGFPNPVGFGPRAKVWEAIVTCAREILAGRPGPWRGTGGPEELLGLTRSAGTKA